MTMTEPGDMKSADSAALWRRFRTLDRAAEPAKATDGAPAALDLAAYAEGRLDAAEQIEAWLAVHPEALDDIIAAPGAGDAIVSPPMIDRAAALVTAEPAGARVVPFRRPTAHYAWRVHVARVAVAASLVLTGLIGFTLGTESYSNLFGTVESITGGLFDQSTGVFTSGDAAT